MPALRVHSSPDRKHWLRFSRRPRSPNIAIDRPDRYACVMAEPSFPTHTAPSLGNNSLRTRLRFSLSTLLSISLLLGSLAALFCAFLRYRSPPFSIPGVRAWEALFSPDEKKILVMYQDGSIRVFDLEFNKLLEKRVPFLQTGQFLPDGNILLRGGKSTCLIDTVSGQEVFSCIGLLCCVSPNGKMFVTTTKDKAIHVWDLTGRETNKFTGHTGFSVFTATFSPDGNQIVSVGDDAVRIWNSKSGVQIAVIPAKTDSPASFSPDGQNVLTSDGQARVWDATTGQEKFSLDMKQVGMAWYTLRGNEIVTAGLPSGLLIWNAAPGQKPRAIEAYHRYSGVWRGHRMLENGECAYSEVWDVENGKQGYFSAWRSPLITDATKDLNLILTSEGNSNIFARIFEPDGPDIWSRAPESKAWTRFRLPQVRWTFYICFMITIVFAFLTFWNFRKDRQKKGLSGEL
jgi:WD40 repeat protein